MAAQELMVSLNSCTTLFFDSYSKVYGYSTVLASFPNNGWIFFSLTGTVVAFYNHVLLELLEPLFRRSRLPSSAMDIPRFRARSSWMEAKSLSNFLILSKWVSNSSFSLMASRLGTNLNFGYFLLFFFRWRFIFGLCIILWSIAAKSSLNSHADFWPYLKSKSKPFSTPSSFMVRGISSYWWRILESSWNRFPLWRIMVQSVSFKNAP